VARVTALRPCSGDQLAVEVDGCEWRVVPADAVVRAGVSEGIELDRRRLRVLRRELRRSEALAVAGRTLRGRDASAAEVEARLERAGVAPAARADALSMLTAAGLVDDVRAAIAACDALARRGWGDAAITDRLDRRGFGPNSIASAQARLEAENARARRIAAARGKSHRTAAYLARRGFSDEAIAVALPDLLAADDAEGYDTPSSFTIFPA
jgi:SOS response regulatory protein OraA/RecX